MLNFFCLSLPRTCDGFCFTLLSYLLGQNNCIHVDQIKTKQIRKMPMNSSKIVRML